MTNIPNNPTIDGDAFNPRNIEPFLHIKSNMPMIMRLKILLPNASPAARLAPDSPPTRRTELMPVPNSGNDVAVANNTTPTNDRPRPVLKAITSADLVNCVAVTRIIAAATVNCVQSMGVDEKSKISLHFYVIFMAV